MDEFKRKYSNEDTLTVALPYFWEHFDPEGFSIWYGHYKYNTELTLAFMSCNLISGECLHTLSRFQFNQTSCVPVGLPSILIINP